MDRGLQALSVTWVKSTLYQNISKDHFDSLDYLTIEVLSGKISTYMYSPNIALIQ